MATRGSFAAAAREIQRDSSVLSRRVSALERRLGTRLLMRTTRAVVLTEAGTLYLARVQAILAELEAANQAASDLAGTARGVLRISMPLSFGRRWIAPLFPRFTHRFSEIQLDARFADRYVDMVAEGFDLAVRIGHPAGRIVPAKSRALIAMLAKELQDSWHWPAALD